MKLCEEYYVKIFTRPKLWFSNEWNKLDAKYQ